jgi:phenylacetate-coenzyme A ligase PaaK-like adenylate-forming protein
LNIGDDSEKLTLLYRAFILPLFETINASDHPCQLGEVGKLLVTNFINLATVLIRYDTHGMAIATDQNCPCGRQLCCFGAIIGRYIVVLRIYQK